MVVLILLDTCAVVDFIFGAILNADIRYSRQQRQNPSLYNRNLHICKKYNDWYRCCKRWLEGKSKRRDSIDIGITATVYEEITDNYKLIRRGGFIDNFLSNIRKSHLSNNRAIRGYLIRRFNDIINHYFSQNLVIQTNVISANNTNLNKILDYMRGMQYILKDPNPPKNDKKILKESFSLARENYNEYNYIEIYSSDRYHFLFLRNLFSNPTLNLPDYFSKIEILDHRNSDITQYEC